MVDAINNIDIITLSPIIEFNFSNIPYLHTKIPAKTLLKCWLRKPHIAENTKVYTFVTTIYLCNKCVNMIKPIEIIQLSFHPSLNTNIKKGEISRTVI